MDCAAILEWTQQDREKIKDFRAWSMSIARQRGVFFTRFLHDRWAEFYSSLYQEKSLSMDYTILGQAVESFWEDMLRIESYHDVEYTDRHKLAAHLFKWLSRMRPIRPTISPRAEDLEKELTAEILQANALFALACAQSFLECSGFSESENQYIIYSSMYRDIHASEWSMIFYLLEKVHPKVS